MEPAMILTLGVVACYLIKGLKKAAPVKTFKTYPREEDTENFEIAEILIKQDLERDALITQEIETMKWEIEQSEAGSSILIYEENSNSVKSRAFTPSTFPKWFAACKFNSKEDFFKVVKRGKGIRFERLKNEAISRLENGYENSHGYNMPQEQFAEIPF